MMSRETYYGALWALLQTVPGIVTTSRRVELLERMEVAQLPAMFMAVASQRMGQLRGREPVHELRAMLYLYAANPDNTVSADMALNALVDAVETVLAPGPNDAAQTLGGLVSHCWIESDKDIEIFAGPLGERAGAIIPVHMLVP